ncbi:alpha-2-macroglobulin [Campylobacter sp. MIT 99-7217]|uniref:alpha-2-macroglobulin family protein n=1 Tax=Campylobacter sp. MIT 99-7217 TaxID=535091 RepID=UPI00115769BF|nr:MG2 domain-containing protein [Campylobacter sp. MIT 99-7217]TQR30981.1 alpha-2-macroglobulin [Campylobacter sp. MIT 99-7217]
MFRFILTFFLAFFISSCTQKPKSELIRAQTDGLLAYTQDLFVEFDESKLLDEKKKALAKLINQKGGLEAKVNGKLEFINASFMENTLKLHFPLKAKSSYKIDFELEQIPVNLSFKTQDLELKLQDSEFKIEGKQRFLYIKFRPNFQLAPDELTKFTKLLKNGKEFPFEVVSNSAFEDFLIIKSKPFELEDEVINFELQFSKKLGLSEDLSFKFTSELKENLSFISAKTRDKDIELGFSDELDEKQNVKDLIMISPNLSFNALVLGNKIKITGNFLNSQNYTIQIAQGLKSKDNIRSKQDFNATISFKDLEPSLSFSSSGVFLPSKADKKIAFKSLNVKKIKLQIYQIHTNNFSQFLRYDDFEARKNLSSLSSRIQDSREYTTQLVLEKSFDLDSKKNEWIQNELSLAALKDLSGAFTLRLSFDEKGADYDFSGFDDYDKSRFFDQKAEISKNLIFSNLALSAEQIGDKIYVSVRDFITNNAVNGVKLELISNKNQILDTKMSGNEGEAILSAKVSNLSTKQASEEYYDYFTNIDEKALFILASKDNQISTLRLSNPLNLDGFDVDGVVKESKIKAFIYTERGVYRPGDKIHLSIVAQNDKERINHPIKLSFYDPKGKKILDNITLEPSNEMFYKELFTNLNDLTGIYKVELDIAGVKFRENILVQAISPNRIKVELETTKKLDLRTNLKLDFALESKYLFGAVASGLKYDIRADFNKKSFVSSKFKNYTFTNPSLYISTSSKNIQAKLDENGMSENYFEIPSQITKQDNTNYEAFLSARVYEEGGKSVNAVKSVDLIKYDYFVGLKKLENSYIEQGQKITFNAIVSDLKENLLKGKKLEYKIYKANHSWWWDYSSFENFVRSNKSGSKLELIEKGELLSADKPISFDFDTKNFYGDMFIELVDVQSGASAGFSFYVSSWGEPSNADIISSLKIKTNKQSYAPNETAVIEFESVKNAKALITLSNEFDILKRFVVDTEDKSTKFELKLDKTYVPNVYVSVSLLQDYEGYENDRALRLFGVVPVRVEDEESKLKLELVAPEKIRPNEEFEISIQSKDKSPYTYTLAVVDEGLLDLTDFKTPDIWGYFYAKRGFALKVFDTYDKIIAKSFGEVLKVLSTGGDASTRDVKNKDEKAERFKPVVLFQAPMKSDEKGFAKAKFAMPSYLGSVRVMVVAHSNKAFGNAWKNIQVSAPAIMLETLPRAIRIDDEFDLLVQVFKLDEDVTSANLSVKTQNKLIELSQNEFKIDFGKEQVKNILIRAKAKKDIGIEEFDFALSAKNYTYKNQTQIDIKPINAYTYENTNLMIKAGESKEFSIEEGFVKGSVNATLKLSATPIVDIDKRLKYLLHYPYGCIEQSTSAVLPQLYLDKFSTKFDKQKAINNINAAIQSFVSFQTADGGFAYWQGGNSSHIWGTNYAGMFLILAKNAGYYVPEGLYQRWLEYEKNFVNKTYFKDEGYGYYLKANSLYLLALAKNANISAMNILYEKLDKLDNLSKWQLAAAYKLAGLDDIALKIASSLSTETNTNLYQSLSYGSTLRDKAIISNAYKIIYGKTNNKLYDEISSALQANSYLSTQSIGYGLYALAFGANLGQAQNDLNMQAELKLDQKNISLNQKDLQIFEFDESKAVLSTKKDIFASFGVEGIKLEQAKPYSKGIRIQREFYDEVGNVIDESKLKSGQSFYMLIKVYNQSGSSFDHLALTQILPSGWELAHTLLDKQEPEFVKKFRAYADFVDARDDKIMWFLDHLTGADDVGASFYVKLSAVTPGIYTLPGAYAEAMYNDSYQALSESKKVVVEK